MQQLGVDGGGRLAARKTHGVKADTDRKHVCARLWARMRAMMCVMVC